MKNLDIHHLVTEMSFQLPEMHSCLSQSPHLQMGLLWYLPRWVIGRIRYIRPCEALKRMPGT